jgi:Exopolysaccharide biosynthesis protein related to N-acetylglucosamine-1-phosphodiester alpha-N-acetylglucosaminidase
VSEIAQEQGAVLAVNGDYYGFRDTGIVIRNGVLYRDEPAREGLVFYTDGTVAVYDETETTGEELLADGAWNTVSFGPALVTDGAVVAGVDDVEIDTNFGNHSIQGEQPRTAVGIIDENHIVFVVVDGRDEGYSRGATLSELAEIMVGLGATTAYNLDGGGSSELWFAGDVVNQPSNGGERATSDIFYIAG